MTPVADGAILYVFYVVYVTIGARFDVDHYRTFQLPVASIILANYKSRNPGTKRNETKRNKTTTITSNCVAHTSVLRMRAWGTELVLVRIRKTGPTAIAPHPKGGGGNTDNSFKRLSRTCDICHNLGRTSAFSLYVKFRT